MVAADAPAKPVLRGWLHAGMTPLVAIGGVVLIALSSTTAGRVGAAVWLVGSLVLFGTSALYHRGNWSAPALAQLRRLDHANIFTFIAATYTPLALVLLADPWALLGIVWGTAVAGITVTLAWPTRPRWLDVVLYLLLGWAGLGWLVAFWTTGGPAVVLLILLGGLCYSVGAVVYALKRPDPSPTWFGFHEIFHACTIAAALCHFAAIAITVLG
ncbi:MAG TPA: hemolysin III family protein [Propionicimonas sp.]|jgi:hemolysin III|nr:hemolysin III family protein [Propionicimonas sp.]